MNRKVYDLAEEFVQMTDCSVFITGKAGTGKTTLLRQMREKTHKIDVVVAPTGVAAINAGGQTIHSFFQLPFTPFIPTPEGARALIEQQQVRSDRREFFQRLELLIIDEISMVRADTLDAIDCVLRHYRYRKNVPFGGVQVIFIGDLYQLSPVCVGEEWQLLSQFYESPYFFHSHVIQQQPPVYIELDHIFRQGNQQFINLLNEVRNNRLNEDSFRLLDRCYNPEFRPKDGDGYITLTTHNKKADSINAVEMAKIDAPVFTFLAEIEGKFDERNCPADEILNLKEGAKVMFLANDTMSERRYYNGKLGRISRIDDDGVFVICDDETEEIPVALEVWENKTVRINPETKQIEEEVLGKFKQIPLRLAWAITIHKSQGLTFDKVVIDAGSAFASGQVYVALSRCRSLDGIVLITPINSRSLAIDKEVLDYSSNRPAEAELERQAALFKAQYSTKILDSIFDFSLIAGNIHHFIGYFLKVVEDFNEETKPYLENLETQSQQIFSVARKFSAQLAALYAAKDTKKLHERVAAASDYFAERMGDLMYEIEHSPATTDSRTESHDYNDQIKKLYGFIAEKRHILLNIRTNFSVNRYFEVKGEFVMPQLLISAYSGEKTEEKSSLLKVKNIDLYKQLVELRNRLCTERDLVVNLVANTKILLEMCNTLPTTLAEMGKIKGFGKTKVERFGPYFLALILRYCKEKGLYTENKKFDFAKEEGCEYETKQKKNKKTKTKKRSKSNEIHD